MDREPIVMEDESIEFISKPHKRRKDCTNIDRCIICQSNNEESLRKAKDTSIEKLISASEIREDDVFHRLCSTDKLKEKEIYWHSSCYEAYTSKENLRYIRPRNAQPSSCDSVSNYRLSQRCTPFDWKTKCLFCKKASHKKDKHLINIRTFNSCNRIRNSAKERGDTELLALLQGIGEDLIAVGGRYHKDCHASYVSPKNVKSQRPQNTPVRGNEFDEAFEELFHAIKPAIEDGKAFDMNTLLRRYQDGLKKRGGDGSSYTRQRLKERLKGVFHDSLVFHQPFGPSTPEIIFSSSISLLDVINAAGSRNSHIHSNKEYEATSSSVTNEDPLREIYLIALRMRQEIQECQGIDICPLNTADLQLDRSKALIPKSLYWLLRWIVTGDDFDLGQASCLNKADERKVIMVAQDVVNSASHARVKLPKHVGLAMTVKHLTGSKQLITLLNRMGHCSSYDEVEQVETSLANETLARAEADGVIIPSNISIGPFIHMAADNNDINEETIDGKNTTHATTLVIYQRKQNEVPPERTIYADHSVRRRSLNPTSSLVTIEEVAVVGRRPAFVDFSGKINMDWFSSSPVMSTSIDDIAWLLLRMSESLFEQNTLGSTESQSIPSWSAFHTVTYPEEPVKTCIGYHPMINAESSNFSTLYTVMKLCQDIANKMGQLEAVLTLDLALYSKARQLQVTFPEQLQNVVLCMGGFHIALNYLALIGKKYANSGLEDLLIESGVYAAGTTTSLLQGKSYNRGIRAHKLVMEALFRLLWEAFVMWLSKQPENQFPCAEMALKIKHCRRNFQIDTFQESWEGAFMPSSMPMFFRFISESKAKSKTFMFWEDYISIVLILLQFVKAERSGNWNLHLSSTAAMVPYFYSMDRMNYSRWLPVYLADMNMLESTHPDVYQEFLHGNHSVSHSNQQFSQVWADMALEQSINLDSKTKGGIVGISTKEHAVERWFLTCHERSSITKSVKKMCGVQSSERVGTHKEASNSRVERDEGDVKKILYTFSSGILRNPFYQCEEETDELLPLFNLATGVVLPDQIADSLLGATAAGKQSMQRFISSRMDSSQINFWEPMKKLSIKTFSSALKTSAKRTKGMLQVGNSERDIFGRLLVVAKNRDVDLKEVLSYELCNVPIALAHPDGTLRKTTKSTLLQHLEKDVRSPSHLLQSQAPTAFLIDAMALIQVIKAAGAVTFGDLATKYEDIIAHVLASNNCTRVDLVFDQYLDVSTKGEERSRRGESRSLEVKIHSAATPVPKQWVKYISNPRNKENLAEFLCRSLIIQLKERLLPTEMVVLAGGLKDGMKAVSVTRGCIDTISDLQCDHEEADTRLLLHAKHAAGTHSRIVIQSPDTDVAVLAVTHYSAISCQELWIKTGTKERQRFIPIHTIHSTLGQPIPQCLPAFHALTGCDTNSSLAGIGKTKAWKVFTTDQHAQQHLIGLGHEIPIQDSVLKSTEAFICALYIPGGAMTRTDEVRHFLFCQRNIRSEGLPPSSESIGHHIMRANFQAAVWNKSLVPIQSLPSPEGNGWDLDDGHLKPVLMKRSPAPTSITELTRCQCVRSECKTNCSCKLNSLACTEACRCMADDEICSNHMNCLVTLDDSSDSEDE